MIHDIHLLQYKTSFVIWPGKSLPSLKTRNGEKNKDCQYLTYFLPDINIKDNSLNQHYVRRKKNHKLPKMWEKQQQINHQIITCLNQQNSSFLFYNNLKTDIPHSTREPVNLKNILTKAKFTLNPVKPTVSQWSTMLQIGLFISFKIGV